MRPGLLLAIASLVFSAGSLACNTAHVSATPDAATCGAIPEVPCKAAAQGTPGCTGTGRTTGQTLEELIPTDASFPEGCHVFVQDPTPDVDNQCIIEGSCICGANDAGALGWTCFESHG